MGEARRRAKKGLSKQKKSSKSIKKDESKRIFTWLPITEEQEELFIRITNKGAWFGIGFLILLWVIVRVIGPAAGWWVPADLK